MIEVHQILEKVLPSDIVFNILDFYFSLVEYEKIKYHFQKELSYSLKIGSCCALFSNCFLNYSMNDLDHEEWYRIYDILYNCDCCSKHTLNKPSVENINESIYVFNYKDTHYEHDEDECECSCRHNCRFIYLHLYPDTKFYI